MRVKNECTNLTGIMIGVGLHKQRLSNRRRLNNNIMGSRDIRWHHKRDPIHSLRRDRCRRHGAHQHVRDITSITQHTIRNRNGIPTSKRPNVGRESYTMSRQIHGIVIQCVAEHQRRTQRTRNRRRK